MRGLKNWYSLFDKYWIVEVRLVGEDIKSCIASINCLYEPQHFFKYIKQLIYTLIEILIKSQNLKKYIFQIPYYSYVSLERVLVSTNPNIFPLKNIHYDSRFAISC